MQRSLEHARASAGPSMSPTHGREQRVAAAGGGREETEEDEDIDDHHHSLDEEKRRHTPPSSEGEKDCDDCLGTEEFRIESPPRQNLNVY